MCNNRGQLDPLAVLVPLPRKSVPSGPPSALLLPCTMSISCLNCAHIRRNSFRGSRICNEESMHLYFRDSKTHYTSLSSPGRVQVAAPPGSAGCDGAAGTDAQEAAGNLYPAALARAQPCVRRDGGTGRHNQHWVKPAYCIACKFVRFLWFLQVAKVFQG